MLLFYCFFVFVHSPYHMFLWVVEKHWCNNQRSKGFRKRSKTAHMLRLRRAEEAVRKGANFTMMPMSDRISIKTIKQFNNEIDK